nr:LON peptidase substrate-binding domain-containing protein [Auraticoccus cholistanensis]
MPMFPLGTVLLPHLPLALRLFEPRYLDMVTDLVDSGELVFGVVLIERGQEVGGGDERFDVGTLAHVVDAARGATTIGITAVGTDRFVVERWLEDDPYPRAEVRLLEPLRWDPGLAPLRERVEEVVRRSLAVASEYAEPPFDPDVVLSDDPLEASWQLAGISPVPELDQLGFLQAESVEQLLTLVHDATVEATGAWRMGWTG